MTLNLTTEIFQYSFSAPIADIMQSVVTSELAHFNACDGNFKLIDTDEPTICPSSFQSKKDSFSNKSNEVSRLNLVDIGKELFLQFSYFAALKEIQFDFKSSSENIEIYSERAKIEIILSKLISNAIKFTPPNGNVSFAILESEDNIELSVKDSGIGLAGNFKSSNEKIALQNKLSEQISNFGTGLLLLQIFSKDISAELSYISGPNKGTTFFIGFKKNPKEQSEYELGLSKNQIQEPDQFSPNNKIEVDSSANKQSVLLIDNNATQRNNIRAILENDFAIIEAYDCVTALHLIGNYKPNLIISSINMPVISGRELCIRIKNDQHTKHIPVVLLTGDCSIERQLESIESGADDYIIQPLEESLFLARITNILKNRDHIQQHFLQSAIHEQPGLTLLSSRIPFIEKLTRITIESFDDYDFSIHKIASKVGLSHSGLYKKIKSETGKSASEFIRLIRLKKAAELFITSDYNVNEAAFKTGFTDVRYFRRQFFKLFQMNPTEYINKYRKQAGAL